MDNMLFITIAISSLLHLLIITMLLGDNPLFHIGEEIIVGSASGYQLALAVFLIIDRCWTPMISGKVIYIIPFALGIISFAQFLPDKYRWIIRYPLSIVVGTGTGIMLRSTVKTQFIDQILATTRLVFTQANGFTSLSNFIVVIGTISSVSYFLFMKSSDVGPMKHVRKLGLYFLLIALGSGFGSTAAYRQSMITGRFAVILAPEAKWITVGLAVIILPILAYLWKQGLVQKD